MNNKKTLYVIVSVLVGMNVAVLSYLFGASRFFGYRDGDLMGGNLMCSANGYCEKHDSDGMGNWDEMEEHMDEMHGGMHSGVNYNKPVAETHKKSYDFGQIYKAEGIVSTTFEIENHGKQTLEIGAISTSCGCTSAEVDTNTLGFNEEAELTVYFDPNFHEEPGGKFSRSVFVKTNDPDLPEMQFDIFVEILE